MLRFARENECDTNIEEISSLLNSKTPFVNELSEEELSSVSGGAIRISTDNTYYKFTGNYNKESDYNNMYLWPQCGRTVHWGSWSRWYCVTCNTSWYDESKLLPNLESRLWNIIPNNLDNRSFDDFKLNPLGWLLCAALMLRFNLLQYKLKFYWSIIEVVVEVILKLILKWYWSKIEVIQKWR